MKCPSEGKLQAYIDKELSKIEKEEIEMHIFLCEKCKETYKSLNDLNDFTVNKIADYSKSNNESHINIKPINIKDIKQKKGVLEMIKPYKKFAIAACAALAITTCVKVQPIQAAISNAVSIFRVQNIKSVNVSLNDMKKLQEGLQSRKSDIQIENLGNVKYSGGKNKVLTLDEAKKELSFTAAIPQNTQGLALHQVNIDEASKIDFTVNVQNVNQILQSLGGKTLLPKKLDGKTFTFDFSSRLGLYYKDTENKKNLFISQWKSPEITAPNDVNVDEIVNCISDLSILPSDLQKQIKSMKDIKNTLYVPNIDNKMEEINVDGVKVMLYADGNYTSAIFVKNGVLFDLNGDIDKNSVIQIIKSLR